MKERFARRFPRRAFLPLFRSALSPIASYFSQGLRSEGPPYIRLSAAYPRCTLRARRKAWNTGEERNMGEFRKIPRALINRL